MAVPLSVTLANTHMIQTENDVVKPMKPLFYKQYVDYIYSRRKKNCIDQLYHELSNYHPNINLTIEINPKKFLDNQAITKNGKKETAVYRKSNTLPVPWSSNIGKPYKKNAIITDMHCPKRISTNFDKEIYRIKKKFLAADYPQKFVERVIRNFENDKIESVGDHYIVPPRFLNIVKAIIIVEIPFCTNNEVSPKHFMRTFHNFTGIKFDLRNNWITKKTKTHFKLKDKCVHPVCKIYPVFAVAAKLI